MATDSLARSFPYNSKKITFIPLVSRVREQGRRQGGAAGTVCPRASGSRGLRQLISNFLFIAFLDVLKEPPNRNGLRGFKSASRFSSHRFPCFLSLLLASIADTRSVILQFALGPRKLLGGPMCEVHFLTLLIKWICLHL